MPRYYFHVCNGSGLTRDEAGQFLGSSEDARLVAVRAAREMMAGDVKEGEVDLSAYISVEDEHGTCLFKVRFGDSVTFTREHDSD